MADDEQADQRESHDLGAADDRRLLVAALGHRRAADRCRRCRRSLGKDTHNQFSPCKDDAKSAVAKPRPRTDSPTTRARLREGSIAAS